MKTAKEMSNEELCRWFAYLNAIKFADIKEKSFKKKIKKMKTFDLPWIKTVEYINIVSGDLNRNLEEKGGIPFKYSLNLDHEESKTLEEINYD